MTSLTPSSVVCSSPLRRLYEGIAGCRVIYKTLPSLNWLPSVTKLVVFKIHDLEEFYADTSSFQFSHLL